MDHAESIFAAAVALGTSSERVAYLDQACANDPALRSHIEARLRAHNLSGHLLDQTAENGPARTGTYEPAATDGTIIAGKYTLVEAIGEGGMGTVWRAKQTEPLKRFVAVKLIKAGMDSKQVLARFEAERQALALMDHPNIAKVLDGGLHERNPFFVMELVKGVPITEYCDKVKLTPKQRLELFVPVCQAIQHAHQKGIIHRDIKPSNVLVALYDDKPVVKVIDFGVAKATGGALTENTIDTGIGGVVGTPQYMSPEQATLNNLDIDTRSDVYALGVLLYELLTGSTPFTKRDLEKKGFLEILRVVREEEPQRPSTKLSTADALPTLSANRGTEPKKLTGLLRNELDWIVMKALEKDRTRRYETANGFAADVQRYLSGEAVHAHPPSTAYRLKKFVRRHKGQVIAASLVLLSLLAGMAGTTYGLYRAETRRMEAEQAQAREAERAEGERLAKLDALAQKSKAEQAEADTLDSYRAATDDAIEQLIGSKPDLGPQEKAYLENTLKRWQAFADRKGDDERGRAIRAEGHFRVGLLWNNLGRDTEARPEYEKAVALREKLTDDFPAVTAYRRDLGRSLTSLGFLLSRLGKHAEAEGQNRKGLVILKKLAEEFPAVPDYRRELARCYSSLGHVLMELGRRSEAEEQYRMGLVLKANLVTDVPAVPGYRMVLATSHKDLAFLQAELGKWAEAEEQYRKGLGILEKLVDEFPAVPDYRSALSGIHINFGMLQSNLRKWVEAEEQYRKGLAIQKKLAADFPAMPDYRRQLSIIHNNLGFMLVGLRKGAEAEEEYRMGLALQEKLAAEIPAVPGYRSNLGNSHTNLGYLLAEQGKHAEAVEQHRKGLALWKKLAADFSALPEYRRGLGRSHACLGLLLSEMGKQAEAEEQCQKGLEIRKNLAANFPRVHEHKLDLGASLSEFGDVLRDGGKSIDSLMWYQKAIEVLRPMYELDPGDAMAKRILRNSLRGRAQAYDGMEKPAEAVKDWDQAVELSEKSDQPKVRASRVKARLLAGQAVVAVAEVADLAKLSNWNNIQWYNFACVYAVASSKLPDQKDEYAKRAVELLRQAMKAGFQDADHMKKDMDLDSLRNREDFKMLLAELENSKLRKK